MPETRRAQGMVRRGLSISSAMKEPVSQPLYAKTMVDQKIAFLNEKCGTKAAAVKCVAGPNRMAAAAARATRTRIESQQPVEQMLLSHLPPSSPRMLTMVMTASHTVAKDMKYAGLAARAWPRAPAAKSSEPAPK